MKGMMSVAYRAKQMMILPVKSLGIKVVASFTEAESRAMMAQMAEWDDDESNQAVLQQRMEYIEETVINAVREVRGLDKWVEDENGNAPTSLTVEVLRAMPAGSAKRILKVLMGADEDDGSGRVVPLAAGKLPEETTD